MNNNMTIEKSLLRIYEGLTRQMIKENVSVEDINDKLNIIMDALGLEETSPKKKEEQPKIEEISKEETTEQHEVPPELEETVEKEDTLTVEESLDSANDKYKLTLNKDIVGYTGNKEVNFKTINELIEYLETALPLRTSYSDVTEIEQNNVSKDKGIIFINAWYSVTKM